MSNVRALRYLAAGLLLIGAGLAHADTQAVTVRYRDPTHFTEARQSAGVHLIDTNAYLAPLKAYIEQRAARVLVPGQRLDVTVTDVDLAGDYERWRGPRFDDIRIVKDLYPPRIDLDFTLYGTNGAVLRRGSRKLRDPAFLTNASPVDRDRLRFEKALIDQWLRKGAEGL